MIKNKFQISYHILYQETILITIVKFQNHTTTVLYLCINRVNQNSFSLSQTRQEICERP